MIKLLLRHITRISFALVLTGCASSSIPVQYYLLNSAEVGDKTTAAASTEKQLLVESVVLADFLNQKHLVMQKGNTLYVAQTHQWAQSPVNSITTAISHDLHQQLPQWRVSQSDYNRGNQAAHKLLVVIDKFHPTDQSTVVLQGSYQLRDTDGKLLTEQHYSLSQQLEQDGFGQSVNQLRDLIDELTQKIAEHLK